MRNYVYMYIIFFCGVISQVERFFVREVEDLQTELANLDPTVPIERILGDDQDRAAAVAELTATAADAGGGDRKFVGGGLEEEHDDVSGRPTEQWVMPGDKLLKTE